MAHATRLLAVVAVEFLHQEPRTLPHRYRKRTAPVGPWDVGLAGGCGRGTEVVDQPQTAGLEDRVEGRDEGAVTYSEVHEPARIHLLRGMDVTVLERVLRDEEIHGAAHGGADAPPGGEMSVDQADRPS